MNRIIVNNRITVDGMFAGPNGELDWFMPDIELDSYVFGPSGKEQPTTVLFGRTTYDMFASYWPKVHSGEMQLDFLPDESLRQHERDIAALLTNLKKVVVTSKDDELGWQNVERLEGDCQQQSRGSKKQAMATLLSLAAAASSPRLKRLV